MEIKGLYYLSLFFPFKILLWIRVSRKKKREREREENDGVALQLSLL